MMKKRKTKLMAFFEMENVTENNFLVTTSDSHPNNLEYRRIPNSNTNESIILSRWRILDDENDPTNTSQLNVSVEIL